MSLLLLFQNATTTEAGSVAAAAAYNIVPLLMMQRRQERMFYLRQATSQTVMLGTYVGSDGVALTGLTLTSSAFMLSKNGAAFTAKNETTSASHRIMGYYSAVLDNTDTGSLGRVLLVSSGASALPVWHEFTVLPSSVFDSLILGSDLLHIDVAAFGGTIGGFGGGRPNVNLTHIDSLATATPSATLNLRQLNIRNTTGASAAVAVYGGNSYHAIEIQGYNQWNAIDVTAVAGRAASFYSNSGHGMNIGGAAGLVISAFETEALGIYADSYHGIDIDGGFHGVNIAGEVGDGIHALANAFAMRLISNSSQAVRIVGLGGGVSIASDSGTGIDINASDGIIVNATARDSWGLSISANSGTGALIYGTKGGVEIDGGGLNTALGIYGGNSYHAIEIQAFNDWRGMSIVSESGNALYVSGQSGFPVNSAFSNAFADAYLKRDFSLINNYSDRSPLQAMRALRNRITTSGGLTVYRENDTTAAWTATLTVNTAAYPIVESDPA